MLLFRNIRQNITVEGKLYRCWRYGHQRSRGTDDSEVRCRGKNAGEVPIVLAKHIGNLLDVTVYSSLAKRIRMKPLCLIAEA